MSNAVKLRPIVSTPLFIVAVLVSFTGFVLYLAPTGRVAREEGWHFLLWKREQFILLHDITGFLMIGLVILHFTVNYRLYRNELRGLFKRKRWPPSPRIPGETVREG